MKILPCAVRGLLAGVMIGIGGYAFLGCENRVVGGAAIYRWADYHYPIWL